MKRVQFEGGKEGQFFLFYLWKFSFHCQILELNFSLADFDFLQKKKNNHHWDLKPLIN